MKYSNKQIKSLLRIQEFVEMSNTLSRIYKEFDDKDLSIINIFDKNKIYKAYCSSIYNLIDAVKQSKYLLENCKKYSEFEVYINREYFASCDKYYSKSNYKSDFYKIMKTIRDQVNHYTRDDEDDNMLFEVNIDFSIIEELRLIINDIFNEVYNKIDKDKIEMIVLSKPKIQYSYDRFNESINLIEKKNNESQSEIDSVFSKENKRSIQILKDYNNPHNVFKLLNNDSEIMQKYDFMDCEMDNMFHELCNYVDENGNELQKETIRLIKEFTTSNKKISKNEYDKNVKRLASDLKELGIRYGVIE